MVGTHPTPLTATNYFVNLVAMNKPLNSAEKIIQKFGGQSALASLIGKWQSTVQHWAKTGRVPAHWHQTLMDLARQRGIALEPKDFMPSTAPDIAPANGRLGILLVGLGAVTSTLIAGVEHVRRGMGQPIGSLTQMATVRVGKRTDGNSPLVKELVPLAELDQLVFGAWDPIPDNAYEAALKSGVLNQYEDIEPIADYLKSIEPMPAAFDSEYVKRISGANVKSAATKMHLVEALRQDIRRFKLTNNCDRLVMIYAASTEKFISESEVHQSVEHFLGGLEENDDEIAPSMLYAYAAMLEGVPFINGSPSLSVDIPVIEQLAVEKGVPIGGKDFKTGQTLVKTVLGPMLKARMLGMEGWFSTNILGNRDGEVLDEPENFRTKEESKLGVLEYILQPELYPELYGDAYHKVRINYYPPPGRQQGRVGQHRHLRLAGPPDADQGQLPLLRLNPRGAVGPRPRAVRRPGQARGARRHPGVAVVLLQEPAPRPQPLPGARPVHPADQAQEHAALAGRRGADHAPGHGLLRGGVGRGFLDSYRRIPQHRVQSPARGIAMGRNTKSLAITLPLDIVQQVDEAAEQQGLSRSAFLRDAIERHVIKGRFQQRRQQAEADVRRMGITPEDVPRLIEEYREEMAVEEAEGVRSTATNA